MVEHESHSVREDFPEQPASEVPHVASPHPLDGVTLCELGKDGVYPVAKTAQESTPFGSRISLFGGVWSEQLDPHARQLLCGLRRVVIAVPDEKAGGALGEFGEHGEFVSVGGGHRDAGDQPRPAEPNVHPEAVEGLPEQRILAEGRFPFEARAER